MTCIVGIELRDGVLIGGDSAGVAGSHVEDRTDLKVFANGHFVVGFSGSYRVGQILQCHWRPPEQPVGLEDWAFMVRDVVESVRKVLQGCGSRGTNGNGDAHDGPFLLGYRGKIYKVDTDFQVGRCREGFNACGSGARVALGALRALRFGDKAGGPEDIVIALDAAEHFDSGVRRPFNFVKGPWTPPLPEQVEIKL